ncbi:MAG: hypothetical protein OHK0038_14460 [Flammeovirgaceae bacterium]
MRAELQTEYSLAWLFVCLLVGIGYAYLLYSKDSPWNIWVNRSLFVVRTILVSCIAFLLLGPYLKMTKNLFEKPTLVVSLDDSESIALVNDTAKISETFQKLQSNILSWKEKGYEVIVQTICTKNIIQNIDSLRFAGKQTDLSGSLKLIQAQQENKNLAGVILVSDGIYNQGVSPLYMPLNMKIFTVGIGDTLPQNDIQLKAVSANKIAYLGNKFPIVVEISNNGFKGKETQINLLQNGKVLQSQKLKFDKENDWQKIEFFEEAKQKGLQKYSISIQTISGEFTTENNSKNIYIEVLDSKEKILLIAANPHPDIKALKAAIEKNKNYELHIFIPDFETKENQFKKEEKYDLVIFHQIPNTLNIGNEWISYFQQTKSATWFILGAKSNLPKFNQSNHVLSLSTSYQSDRVTPIFNNRFNRFSYSSDFQDIINLMPPVTVPYSDIKLSGSSEVIIWQRVGSVVTQKPLLAVNDQSGLKSAVMVGEGLWQWRLQEYAQHQNFDAFDELIGKIVQYLSTKEDKRKFRVYTTDEQYAEGESVLFETEVYNDIYEKVYGQKIELQVNGEDGYNRSFSFVNSGYGFRYALNGLEEGIYKFRASTNLNGQQEVSTGEFSVQHSTLEALNTTADFNLLRQLASQNKGKFYQTTEIDQLKADFLNEKPADVIHSQEQFENLLTNYWLFLIFILLASVEWTTRKLKGGY